MYSGIKVVSRGKEKVSGSFSYLIYDVRYYSVADGLVAYEAEINTERVMSGVTSALVMVGAVLFTLATGTPAYVPA